MSHASQPPRPEDIQKEFESFIKKKFGENVQVVAQPMTIGDINETEADETLAEEPETKEFDLNFRYTPKEVKRHLDKFVIQQDDAKKALAIAVCDHYNYVRQHHEKTNTLETEYAKQNVMVLGPTGVGKTYLIRQIAKFIGVPFVKADATRFSETGYVGSNVDDLVYDLVAQAGGDIELAQYGIVYLDEADKLAAPPSAGRDIGGRGVQFGLLKLMEETEVDLRAGNDMRSQLQAFMEFQRKGKVARQVINTRHILFIVSGAFTGLVDIIKERLNQNHIGFHTEAKKIQEDDDFLKLAATEDFVNFGFEPEFIGRLPIRVSCQHLSVDDLHSVLKDSKGSIVNQYRQAFRAYDIDLEFEDAALRKIAELAANEKTGARALMTTCERLLRGFKYELPSVAIDKLVITHDILENPEIALNQILADPRHKPKARNEDVMAYVAEFHTKHGMTLEFTAEAIATLEKISADIGSPIVQICDDHFNGYEHGLKLIQQNTTQKHFVITEEVIEDPKKALESWIKQSYQTIDNQRSERELHT